VITAGDGTIAQVAASRDEETPVAGRPGGTRNRATETPGGARAAARAVARTMSSPMARHGGPSARQPSATRGDPHSGIADPKATATVDPAAAPRTVAARAATGRPSVGIRVGIDLPSAVDLVATDPHFAAGPVAIDRLSAADRAATGRRSVAARVGIGLPSAGKTAIGRPRGTAEARVVDRRSGTVMTRLAAIGLPTGKVGVATAPSTRI
jgi:hypothetical protein